MSPELAPVTLAEAEASGQIEETRDGLSLGDRLCIALSQRLSAEILTADEAREEIPGVTSIR